MYLIVHFEEDNKTGPVAKEWFSDGLAWWPPFRDKFHILRSVQKRVVPCPLKGWKQFAARVLYESDSIDKIQEKWERSCVTSDLNTDKEQEPTIARQRRKPKRLRSPSPSSTSPLPSEEDDHLTTQSCPPKTPKRVHRFPPKNLPAPPLIPVVKGPMSTDTVRAAISQARPVSSNSDHDPLPFWQPSNMGSSQLISQARPVSSNSDHDPLPFWQPSNMDSSQWISQARPVSSNSDHGPHPIWQPSNMDSSQLISQARTVSSNTNHGPVSVWQPNNMDSSQRMTSNLSLELSSSETECHQRPTYTELTTVRRRPGEVEARHPTPLSDAGLDFSEQSRHRLPNTHQLIPTNCTAVERLVLEQLGELHLKVDHLTATVQSLCQNRAQNQQPQSSDYDHLLPISTLEELNRFDEKLRQDIDFKKHVIAKLSITGGNSVKKTVWRVCRKVFSPELATQLNWCGRGQKTGIKSRPVHEILQLSVSKNGALPHITEAEIETAIQNWLRLSQDRLGGRRRQRPER
ncbi:uncharacterized protein [Misgurnus anguillicaudatus]|uniref:uncharacterized protein isoform X3 n=1 Tax=Misgurnus anguillicaudatus TaxID=75329 RepID=UPI003CCEFD47